MKYYMKNLLVDKKAIDKVVVLMRFVNCKLVNC